MSSETTKENDDILKNITSFMKDRTYYSRDASFDYCYNYFQNFKDNPTDIITPENIEQSCLQLGFYLASWGMYRKSFLLSGSCLVFKPMLEKLTNFPKKDWEKLYTTDVDDYDKDHVVELLTKCACVIRSSLLEERNRLNELKKKNEEKKLTGVTGTLVTKIMLGMFANVPAFDANFCACPEFKACARVNNPDWSKTKSKESESEFKDAFKVALTAIHTFYNDAKIKICVDELNKNTHTLDFQRSAEKNADEKTHAYTKAKLIDMHGFIKGKCLIEIETDKKKKQKVKPDEP